MVNFMLNLVEIVARIVVVGSVIALAITLLNVVGS